MGEGQEAAEAGGIWRVGGRGGGGGVMMCEELEDALADESVNVEVSRVDRDPYGIVVLEGSQVEGMKI